MPRTEPMPRRTAGPPLAPRARAASSRPAIAVPVSVSRVASAAEALRSGRAHLDAVAAGVLHERVRRVEAHRLGVEQAGAERRRVAPLEPRRRVDEVGEAHRVALGEAVVGEGGELLPEHLDGVGVDAPLGRRRRGSAARSRSIRSRLRFEPIAWRSWSASAAREAADVDGHLHELLLEQRHAEGLGQRPLGQRVQVGDRLLAVAAADVGVHRAALDGAGADEGDLDDEVVEAAGLAAGAAWPSGPGTRPGTRRPSRPGRACRRRRRPGRWWRGRRRRRGRRATRSTAWWRAVSIPRPSRSNFTSPTAAQSSLSHCSTVRIGSCRCRCGREAGPLDRAHLDRPAGRR